MGDDLLKLEQKALLAREDAAARLHAIADELASGNGVVFEQDGRRYVAKTPAQVRMKLELELEDGETEFEIKLSW